MQLQLVLPLWRTRNTNGNSYLTWLLEKSKYPRKYIRKSLRRKFIAQGNYVCGKTRVYVYENTKKLTPIENYIKKSKTKQQHNLLAPLWRQNEHAKLRKERPWAFAIRGAKARSTTAGLPFDLNEEWGKNTYTGECSLTGIPFVFIKGNKNYKSASIDRIDPSKGYTQDNCRWVLFAINAFKQDATDTEMYFMAVSLLNNVNLTTTTFQLPGIR